MFTRQQCSRYDYKRVNLLLFTSSLEGVSRRWRMALCKWGSYKGNSSGCAKTRRSWRRETRSWKLSSGRPRMPAKRTGIATRPSWRDSTDGYGAALRSSSKNLSHSLTPWWSDNLKLTHCRSNSWRRSWKNRMLKKRWRQAEKKSNSLSPTYSWWCLALFYRPLFPLLFIIYNRSTLSACSLLIKTLCVITYVWQQLRDSSQERLALLEARLTEEQDWRKQLEADLSAAQAALRKDKEVHWSPQKINTITKIAEIQFFKVKSNPCVLLTCN